MDEQISTIILNKNYKIIKLNYKNELDVTSNEIITIQYLLNNIININYKNIKDVKINYFILLKQIQIKKNIVINNRDVYILNI